jgi:hypothetical protein
LCRSCTVGDGEARAKGEEDKNVTREQHDRATGVELQHRSVPRMMGEAREGGKEGGGQGRGKDKGGGGARERRTREWMNR